MKMSLTANSMFKMGPTKRDPPPVPKGKLLLSEEPFVYALKSQFRDERCDFCFSSGTLQKCGNCRYVSYCNRTCQREAWRNHKLECPCLLKVAPRIVPDAARMLSRIILKLNNGGEFVKSFYTDKLYRQFKDLMSHYQSIKNDSRRIEHVESLYEVLKQLLGNAMLPNFTDLLIIYGRMLVNAFNILDTDLNSIGTGIYLAVSVIDHSCQPNAVATFDGITINVRTTKAIPKLDFSLIFISYLDLTNTAEHRQQELQQNYFFLCECARCLDPVEASEMNAAACPNPKCSAPVDFRKSPDLNKCTKCFITIPAEHLQRFHEITELTKSHVENMKHTAYLDVCRIMLTKQRGILHPLNVWHVKTLDLAFESAINVGKFDEALEFGNELVPGFTKYYGVSNPLLGLLHMKIGKMLLLNDHRKEAMHHLDKASEIINCTHGKHSPLYAELAPLMLQAAF